MVYLVANLKIHSGRNKEFLVMLQSEYIPILVNKYNWKLIAAWQVQVGDIDEIIDVWGFNDISDFCSSRTKMLDDTEFLGLRAKLRPMLREETIRLVTSLAVSPI